VWPQGHKSLPPAMMAGQQQHRNLIGAAMRAFHLCFQAVGWRINPNLKIWQQPQMHLSSVKDPCLQVAGAAEVGVG
jgi:hypothetical protein